MDALGLVGGFKRALNLVESIVLESDRLVNDGIIVGRIKVLLLEGAYEALARAPTS